MSPSPVLVLDDIWKAWRRYPRRAREVLRGVDWSLGSGRVAIVRGANGTGKSTMLAIAAGLVRPSRGRASICGHAAGDPRALRRLGWHSETPAFREDLPLLAVLEEHLEAFGFSRRAARGRAAEMLEAVGLGAETSTLARECSAGMRQRLALARAVAHAPRLLLLDEPFAALDVDGRGLVGWAARQVTEAGGAAVIVSHLDAMIEDIGGSRWLLEGGVLHREDSP